MCLITAAVESKFIFVVSNFDSRCLNWFKLFAVVLLYLMKFLIKFVSGLGRTISPLLLLLRLEFLWTNRCWSSVALYPLMHLKVNSANRTLYILPRLSHCVCIKTSVVLVSHDTSSSSYNFLSLAVIFLGC